MSDRVLIQRDQQVTSDDLTNIGLNAQNALDTLTRNAIEPGLKYAGFPVIESGAGQVTVGSGIVLGDGKMYERDDEGGVQIDMLTNLPAVANKYVAIVAWGQEIDTKVEPRTFLLDPVTRQTEARAVATVKRRYANVDKVLGTESTSPQPPLVGADIVIVALVLLGPSGILSITQNVDNKLFSVRNAADEIAALTLWRNQTGARLETIQTDITGLSDKMRGAVRVENFLEAARDIANLKAKAGLPSSYASYGYDPFLVVDQSQTDVGHPSMDCLVEEGIRMPPITSHSAQVNILNADDVKVTKTDNLIIPAYTEVERIVSVGRDDEISLAQYENQTVELVQKTVSRQRTRFGGTKTVCTNSSWWRSGYYDPISGIFRRAGETWTVNEADRAKTSRNHQSIRVTQFWVDTYEEAYMEANVVTTSVNGSVVAQTFLNSQATWLTAIGLYFTRAGNANVNLALCEVTDSGAPDFSKVIAQTTIAPADIKIYPLQTKVPMPLTMLERGKRYAIVPISTGSHYLALTVGNKFNQGSLFYSTDGSWFQGDLIKDLAFVIFAAKFDSPRVEVQLESLELTGGIFEIDINTDAVIPDGCSLTYEVRINNVWTPISEASLDVLTSLPPLLQFRAVFQGTTDVMPRMGVGSKGQVLTSRPKLAFVHVSSVLTPPVPVNTVWVDIRLESWDPAHNTIDVRLLSGAGYATDTDAGVVQIMPDPNGDPNAKIQRHIFSYGSAISSFKIKTLGNTDSIFQIFHVALRQHVALNV